MIFAHLFGKIPYRRSLPVLQTVYGLQEDILQSGIQETVILEYAQNLDQLYSNIVNNSLNCLHHTGIGTQNIIQSTFNLR